MAETNKAKEVFDAAVAAKKTEDEIKCALVSAGFSFKDASKIFMELAIETGLVISSKARKEQIKAILDTVIGSSEKVDEELFVDVVGTIIKDVKGTDESASARAVRAYCKAGEIEIDLPKKRPGGRVTQTMFGLIEDNPTATKEEVSEMLRAAGCSEKQHPKLVAYYCDVVNLIQRIINK